MLTGGLQLVTNDTGRDEYLLTFDQWQELNDG